MDLCIDTDIKILEIAEKQCPENYHIEYTRRGYIIYVKDGYHYDVDNDLCYEVS